MKLKQKKKALKEFRNKKALKAMTLGVAGVSATIAFGASANADEVPNTTGAGNTTSVGAGGADAEHQGNWTPISQNDASVQNAANAAQNAGANVTQTDGNTYYAGGYDATQELNSAQQTIDNDYNSQIKNLNSAEEAAKGSNAVKDAVNNANATVNQAQQDAANAGVKVEQDKVNYPDNKEVYDQSSQAINPDVAQKTVDQINNSVNDQVKHLNDAKSFAVASNEIKETANKVNGEIIAKKDEAQNSGVNVTADPVVEYDDDDVRENGPKIPSEINDSKNQQIESLNKAINDAKARDRLKDEVAKQNALVNSAIEELKKAGVAVNKKGTKEYGVDFGNADQSANDKINDVKASASDIINKANQVKDQINNAKKESNNLPKNPQYASNGYTALNTWQNLNYDGKASEVIPSGSLGDGNNVTLTVLSDVPKSSIPKRISWDGRTPELVSGSFADTNAVIGRYDYYQDHTLLAVKNNTTLRFKDAMEFQDGSIQDLLVKFIVRGEGYKDDIIAVWDKDGSINSYVGGAHANNSAANQMVFNAADGRMVFWTVNAVDIDMGQKLFTSVNDDGIAGLAGIGGGVNVFRDNFNHNTIGIASHPNLGDVNPPFGKNATLKDALTGINSAPDGSASLYSYAPGLDVTLQNQGGQAVGVATGYFGAGMLSDVKTFSFDYTDFSSQDQQVNVNYHLFNNDQVSQPVAVYHNYESKIPTPQATYHFNKLLYGGGDTEKHAEQTVNNNSVMIDGKYLTKGDHVVYNISTADLPANREFNLDSSKNGYTVVDKLPEGMKLVSWTATDGATGNSLTDMFNASFDEVTNTITLTSKQALNDIMNNDKSKAYKMPVIHLETEVMTEATKFVNTPETYQNNVKSVGLGVTVTSVEFKPKKEVKVDGDSADGEGKKVIQGDTLNYGITWDLEGLGKDTSVSDAQLIKGLGIVDNYDAQTTAVKDSLKVLDKDGKDVEGLDVKWDDNAHSLTISVKGSDTQTNTAKTLRDWVAKYGGQKLTVKFDATVNENKEGTILNKATQNTFGQFKDTNTVTNKVFVLDPVKDVVKNAGETVSIDGQTVDLNSNIAYALKSSNFEAGRGTVITKWQMTDKLDVTHVNPTGLWVVHLNTPLTINGIDYGANSDISKYFTYNYDVSTGTATLTAEPVFLAAVNANKDKDVKFTGFIQNEVIKSGWAYNTFDEIINTSENESNEVKIFAYEPVKPEPNKDVKLGNADAPDIVLQNSIDGKTVVKGDTIAYTLNGQELPQYHEKIKTVSVTDVFDKGVEYIGFKAFLPQADGSKLDVTDHVKEQKDGNTVVFVADQELVDMLNSDEYNTKSSYIPTIVAYAKVTEDAEKIDNTYWLNINGKQDVSNIVENKTPDPKPVKHDNNTNGVDIDGKTVLPNSTNVYDTIWDLGSYKDAVASKDVISKGFYFIDDYPEEAVDVDLNEFSAHTLDGQDVDGLEKNVYTSLDQAPKELQDILKANNKSINGAFVVWSAKDPQSFFDKYVTTGTGIKLVMPMKVKGDLADKQKYENKAFEIDMGNVYDTNVVSNNVKKPDPKKDVVSYVDNTKSINNTAIEMNSDFNYVLKGSKLDKDMGTPITQYGFSDDYDETRDSYSGQYVVLGTTAIKLKDGTTYVVGTDLSKFTTQVIDQQKGAFTVEFNKDFLDSIDWVNSEFGADIYAKFLRIGTGVALNTYSNTINGNPYWSNEVETVTYVPVDPKDPVKVVTIGKTDDATGAVDDNNKGMIAGQQATFTLKGVKLPAYHEPVTELAYTDDFDKDFEYQGFKAYMMLDGKNTDVSEYFTENKEGTLVKWVANEALLKLLNTGKWNSDEVVTPTILAYGKVNDDASGEDIDNTFTITVNDKSGVSNKTHDKVAKFDPHKVVLDQKGEDINDNHIMQGAVLNYQFDWDLSDLKDVKLTDDDYAKAWAVADDYDQGKLTISKEYQDKLAVLDESGNDITNETNVVWNIEDGSFVIVPKDNKAFLEKYKGQRLKVSFFAKVNDDAVGQIDNTASQTNAGITVLTNVVHNYVHELRPEKMVIDVNGQVLPDNANIKLNDVFEYSLTSSERPANDKDDTTEWSIVDILDSRDEPTGKWSVKTRNNLRTKDGLINAGDDISSYFEAKWDPDTREMKIFAKQEFLDMINEYNTDIAVQWIANVEVKRVGTGTIENIFTESYNNTTRNSNRVITHTDEPTPDPEPNPDPDVPSVPDKPGVPETPVTPPNTPEQPAQPVTPTQVSTTPSMAVPSPEPIPLKKEVSSLPQMGDSDNNKAMAALGLLALGMGFGLLGYKKRKDGLTD